MKKSGLFISVFCILLLISSVQVNAAGTGKEIPILQSWQGDYPTDKLDMLPDGQQESNVGLIVDTDTFADVWRAFRPGEPDPDIDFSTSLVIFARNTRFYNRISIGRVGVQDGIAEVLAMETLSAMPIEDRVAMSLVVVNKNGIRGISAGKEIISLQ